MHAVQAIAVITLISTEDEYVWIPRDHGQMAGKFLDWLWCNSSISQIKSPLILSSHRSFGSIPTVGHWSIILINGDPNLPLFLFARCNNPQQKLRKTWEVRGLMKNQGILRTAGNAFSFARLALMWTNFLIF